MSKNLGRHISAINSHHQAKLEERSVICVVCTVCYSTTWWLLSSS